MRKIEHKYFNGQKYFMIEDRWLTTTHPRTYLSHDVWNYYNPNNVTKDGEDVHHINGDTSDDRIENLQKMTHSKHISFHQTKENNLNWKGGMKFKSVYLCGETVEKGMYCSVQQYINSIGEVKSNYFDFDTRNMQK